MALTGNTVQSTYLDLVQLEQSGAGLPSHAGKEAALYDGSGAQILGRTAQRHWLDPHPDAVAFDETWEFSTTGDMNQAALEAAGWTFSEATAEVSNGILWVTTSAAGWARAELTVNFTGDFDVVAAPIMPFDYGAVGNINKYQGGMAVADTSNDVYHGVDINSSNGLGSAITYKGGTYSTGLGGATTSTSTYARLSTVRILRVSGTVYFAGGFGCGGFSYLKEDDTGHGNHGWSDENTEADADTYQKLVLLPYVPHSNTTGLKCGFRFIRRFQ